MVTPFNEKNYELVGKPYWKGDKQYICGKHKNTGNSKELRWYDSFDYIVSQKLTREEYGWDNLKESLGFKEGPIIVLTGAMSVEMEEWCKAAKDIRFNVPFGWFIPSDCHIPEDAPPQLTYILMGWEEVSVDDRHLLPTKEILEKIRKKVKVGRDKVIV